MRFEVLGTVNDPGMPGKTGDDRFGFDAAAGRAWVLDGATDVSPLKPFPHHESGASWFAETLSGWLLDHPPEGVPDADFWRTALGAMRAAAERESDLPLGSLPLEASPIASGMTAFLTTEQLSFQWLGDCVALVDPGAGTPQIVGALDKQDDETVYSQRVLALSEAERWADLQRQRAEQNTDGRWIFGLNPDAARHVETLRLGAAIDMEIILMSDGLFRLIEPYRSHSVAEVFALARRDGLLGLIRALRAQEGDGKETAALRIKPRDDACGVWLRVVD